MTDSIQYKIIQHLLVALIAGGLIGLERSYHGRPAGFRTHALVCVLGSMLMLVTVYQADWYAHGGDGSHQHRSDAHGAGHHDRHRLPRRRRDHQGRPVGARPDHRGLDLDDGRDRHPGRHRLLLPGGRRSRC